MPLTPEQAAEAAMIPSEDLRVHTLGQQALQEQMTDLRVRSFRYGRLASIATSLVATISAAEFTPVLGIAQASQDINSSLVHNLNLADCSITDTNPNCTSSGGSISGSSSVGVSVGVGGGSSGRNNQRNHNRTASTHAGQQIAHPADLNQESPAYDGDIHHNGCGIISQADSVQDVIHRPVSVNFIRSLSQPAYGRMDNEYLNESMPKVAKFYGLRYYKTDLVGAFNAVEHGYPAIVLATQGRYTGGSHYFNLARARYHNGQKQLQDFDPYHGHGNNLTWNSIAGYQQDGVLNQAWILAPKKS